MRILAVIYIIIFGIVGLGSFVAWLTSMFEPTIDKIVTPIALGIFIFCLGLVIIIGCYIEETRD